MEINCPNDSSNDLAHDKYFLSSIMEIIAHTTLSSNIESNYLSFILMALWVTNEANTASRLSLLVCLKMKIESKILCTKMPIWILKESSIKNTCDLSLLCPNHIRPILITLHLILCIYKCDFSSTFACISHKTKIRTCMLCDGNPQSFQ